MTTTPTTVEWRSMFLASKPILEWAAANPLIVGDDRAQQARRTLVRYYLATSIGPGIAKAVQRVTSDRSDAP